MPRGRKKNLATGTVKRFTPRDAAELYSDPMFVDESGNLLTGMFRGNPWWIAWFVSERKRDFVTDDSHRVYVLTEEERAAFEPLRDANHVIISIDDQRDRYKSFVFGVVRVSAEPFADGESSSQVTEQDTATAT